MKRERLSYDAQQALIEHMEVQIEELREQLEASTRGVSAEFEFTPELGAISRFAERWATYARETEDPRGVLASRTLKALELVLWQKNVDGAPEFERAVKRVLRLNAVTDVEDFEGAKKHLFGPIVAGMVKHIAAAYEKHDPTTPAARVSGAVDLTRSARACATCFVVSAKKHPGMLPRFGEATTPQTTRALVHELAEHLKITHPRARRTAKDARERVTCWEAACSWTREALKFCGMPAAEADNALKGVTP